MSTFKVPVIEIEVLAHPDADRIEIAKSVGMDYNMIIPKGQYKTGDSVVYIPEQAVVPESILEELGLVGKLAGSAANRVKATRFRGVISQGLVYPNKSNKPLGTDMADDLGIEKYEVPIPPSMRGEICNIGYDHSLSFDVENIKNYPNVFTDEDLVEVTEKIHGTFMMVSGFPEGGFTHPEIMFGGRSFCCSKTYASKGLAFKDNDMNAKNTYIRTSKKFELDRIVAEMADIFGAQVALLGEVFGKGVQDMEYGGKDNKQEFRVFDICKKDSKGFWVWLERSEVKDLCDKFNLNMTTILYRGLFNKDKILELTNGKETISGKSLHLREGVVIRGVDVNTKDPEIGRRLLKSISFDYLNRKNGTEYN